MPSKPDKTATYLFHILENITLARQFIAGLSYPQFRDDTIVFYAVTRALEIISEASRRLPADLKERHAHIPWLDVAGAGNVYRHDYEDVRQRSVWVTVHTHLPDLLAVVELELRQLNELP